MNAPKPNHNYAFLAHKAKGDDLIRYALYSMVRRFACFSKHSTMGRGPARRKYRKLAGRYQRLLRKMNEPT